MRRVTAWTVAAAMMMSVGGGVTTARGAEGVSSGNADDVPIMVVLDVSGSMDEAAGDGSTTKIEDARRAVIDLIDVLDPTQRVGLLSYPGGGRSDAEGCSLGEVQFDIGAPDKLDASLKVRKLQADGDTTPTSAALNQAAGLLNPGGGDARRGVIVLVSDGQANCGAPVCETAKKLRAQHIELTVNTVGFDTADDSELSDALRCVAAATGGRYANARDAEELRRALRELAASNIEVTADVPERLPVVVGRSAGTGSIARVTVTNTGTVEAADVRVSLDFADSDDRGGALLVTRPVKFVGNVPAGETRAVEFEVRPDDSRVDESFTWYVTATTSSKGGDLATGSSRTVSQSDLPLGRFLDVDGPVAIVGDSYSSGEGGGSYLANTAKEESTGRCSVDPRTVLPTIGPSTAPSTVPCKIKTGTACHKSAATYGRYLFAARARIIACSGAVTSDFYGSRSSGGLLVTPQLRELRDMALSKDSPEAVMLTIGGNDVGFTDLITACASSSECWTGWTRYVTAPFQARPESAVYVDRIGAITNDLLDVYRDVNSAVNDTRARERRDGQVAPVVVLPYVRIIPSGRASTAGCFAGISQSEVAFLNSFIDLLNSTIALAVLRLQKEGLPIYYASDVVDAMQPDHTICDGAQSYAVTQRISPKVLQKDQQWLHPNADGYRAVAGAVAGWSRTARPVTGTKAAEYGSSSRSKALEAAWVRSLSPFTSIPGVKSSGAGVSMNAGGFAPGSQVVLGSRSTPRAVGSAYADEQGDVSLRGRLSSTMPIGRHRVVAIGVGPEGQPREVVATIWVVPRHSVLAVLLLLLGAVAFVIGVRRRRSVTGRSW